MAEPVVISGVEGQLIVSRDGRAMAHWQQEPVVAIWPALIEAWPYWLGAIAGLWLLIATLLMILRYRRPRAVGEPHCRRCNYQLTGLRSESCPECGAALTERTIVIGKRVRRRLIRNSFIGAVLLSLGYTAMLLGGVPRQGVVSAWFDWHSATVARWAEKLNIDRLKDWERETYVIVPVDMDTGLMKTRPRRRFLSGSASQPPFFSLDRRRIYLRDFTVARALNATTLRDEQVYATNSNEIVEGVFTDYSQKTLMLWRSTLAVDRFRLDGDGTFLGQEQLPDGTDRLYAPPGRTGLVALVREMGRDRVLWSADDRGNWLRGQTIPSELDFTRADFMRDGRHLLIPNHRRDTLAQDKLFIFDADDGRLVHAMEFERSVPDFKIAESRRWLITWGEDATTGQVGVEIISLNTGKLLHKIDLGDDVSIDRAWEAQTEPTLLVLGWYDLPNDDRRLLWRFDLTELIEQHPDPPRKPDNNDTAP